MSGWLRERSGLIAAVLISRALVLGAAAVDHVLHWPYAPRTPHGAATSYVFSVLSDWDGRWYRIVAERGYMLIPGRQSNPAFFPLLPIALRAVHALGLSYPTAALVLVNCAFLVGIVAFYELGRRLMPAETARTAALLAAFFPMSFVFSMAYPESLVFAALTLALVLALDNRWTASALAATVAAIGRPEALFFALPLAVIAFEHTRRLGRPASARAFGAAVAPVVSVVTFPLYLGWSLHNVFAWSSAQHAWGRSFALTGVGRAFGGLLKAGAPAWMWRDFGLCLLYLVLIWLARRANIGWPWLAAGAGLLVVPLTSGTFMSEARFGVLALPVYWGLAVLARRRQVRFAIVGVSAILLVVATMTIPLATP